MRPFGPGLPDLERRGEVVAGAGARCLPDLRRFGPRAQRVLSHPRLEREGTAAGSRQDRPVRRRRRPAHGTAPNRGRALGPRYDHRGGLALLGSAAAPDRGVPTPRARRKRRAAAGSAIAAARARVLRPRRREARRGTDTAARSARTAAEVLAALRRAPSLASRRPLGRGSPGPGGVPARRGARTRL